MKGFKECCTSRAVDGTEDDMLWNGSAEDGDVRRDCQQDELFGKDRQNLMCVV